GAADSHGAIHNPEGLDVASLIRLKDQGGSVTDYVDAMRLQSDQVIDIECDIWIPAARPDVINQSNVERLKAKLLVEAANIPVTPAAEETLYKRGVFYVPDFIANAGGVICAAMEYQGATEAGVFAAIEEKLRRNTEIVLAAASEEGMTPRRAAIQLAGERVKKVMGYRRWSLFSSAPGFI
ncbi:MAG: Glu/Leu/Phe/Val dehydrogenase, partial [Pseudomonadota bacterium]